MHKICHQIASSCEEWGTAKKGQQKEMKLEENGML